VLKKNQAMNLPLFGKADTSDQFDPKATSVILAGDSAETLKTVPGGSMKLIITSPPSQRASELDSIREELNIVPFLVMLKTQIT